MRLREQILKEHSKENCNKLVQWVGASPDRFDKLFYLFLHDEYRVVQRASWPISYCVEAHPGLIKKHFTALLDHLEKPGIHAAVKRNTIRLLQFIEIPKRYHGRLMDLCFGYLGDPREAITVKVFSLTVLQHLAAFYPEILPELKLLVEENCGYGTAAFKARARQFNKAVSK
jgi:hypothetical protein